MLNNPVFRREFISAARSGKAKFLVLAYIIVLSLVLLAMWPGGGVLSAVSESGRKIFQLFFTVNLTLLMLMIPAFAATAITSERENDTYPALYTTLLSPTEIMAGKLVSSILLLVMIVVLASPIAAITSLTGGVNIPFLFKITLLLIVSAISYGLIGLVCSTYFSTSSSAILANYITILILAGGTWLPGALLGNIVGFKFFWQILRSVSPYDAMLYILNPDSYKLSMLVYSVNPVFNPYVIFLCFSASISFVAFVLFFKRILKPPAKFAKTQQKYSDTKTSIKRTLSWPFYLIDPLKRKKPIGNWSNPVYIAELRSKIFSNPKFMIRTIFAIFILSLLLLTLVSFQLGEKVNPERVWAIAIIFQTGIVALLTPGISSGLITEELANNTFVSLRMTPLSPSTVIIGKLKATLFYAIIFLISSIFILFAMAYLEVQTLFPEGSILNGEWWRELAKKASEDAWWLKFWMTYRRIFIWVLILVLSTITFLSGGLFASSVAKRTNIATAVAYSISAFICVVSMAPLVMGERLSENLSSFVLSFNPIISAMQISFGVLPQYPDLWKNNLLTLCLLIFAFLFVSICRTWYLFRKQE